MFIIGDMAWRSEPLPPSASFKDISSCEPFMPKSGVLKRGTGCPLEDRADVVNASHVEEAMENSG